MTPNDLPEAVRPLFRRFLKQPGTLSANEWYLMLLPAVRLAADARIGAQIWRARVSRCIACHERENAWPRPDIFKLLKD